MNISEKLFSEPKDIKKVITDFWSNVARWASVHTKDLSYTVGYENVIHPMLNRIGAKEGNCMQSVCGEYL